MPLEFWAAWGVLQGKCSLEMGVQIGSDGGDRFDFLFGGVRCLRVYNQIELTWAMWSDSS